MQKKGHKSGRDAVGKACKHYACVM